MDQKEFDKARAINKSLIKKGLPAEIRIKILIETFGISGLAKICGDEPELMDVCGIYKNTICKATLETWKINYDPNVISACELVKRMLYIIMSNINYSADAISDAEENYNLNWAIFSDTQNLNVRNTMICRWAIKWDDIVVLQVMLNYNNVKIDDLKISKELVEIACRENNLPILQFLMSLGITEQEAFEDGLVSAVSYARVEILDYLLSAGIGDEERLLERSIRSDVPPVFLYFVFKRGIDVQSYTNVESPQILRQLVELVKRAYLSQ